MIYRAFLHWTIFIPTFFWIIVSLVLLAGLPEEVKPISILALIVAILFCLKAYIDYSTSEFGLTNRRVIMKTGLIRRQTIEFILRNVDSISVKQTILGRLLDYGDITVLGSGISNTTFSHIGKPIVFRNHINEQVSKHT
ncbi:PH domain-containing protein [bacterium]|nr:PH domain-containing protein [bacterium]